MITGLFSLAHGDEIDGETHYKYAAVFHQGENLFFFSSSSFQLSLELRQRFGFLILCIVLLVIVKTVSHSGAVLGTAGKHLLSNT